MTEDEHDVVQEDNPQFFEALVDDDPVELYENAPCGYVSMLPDGTIVKANQTFFAWTEFTRSQVVGRRRLQELFPVGDRIFYETHLAPLLRMQGRLREVAVDLVLGDGTRLPVLVNAILKRDRAGNPQFVRAVLFDARERRAYERELVAARDRAVVAETRARHLAETLQASFLPPTSIEIPGLDVGAVYRPSGDGGEVGGDFYDVFPTGRGTHAIVLGDVSGKGPEAAVVTTLARHVVRAEILHSTSPARVLTILHDAISAAHPDRFCTALLLEVGTSDGGLRVSIAAAGHALPIRSDGATTARVGKQGTLLGMLDRSVVVDEAVTLRPEEVLVLYTDGVTEARDSTGAFFGDDRVEDLVAELAGRPAPAVAAGVAEAAVSFQHGFTSDDIAVLALRQAPPSDTPGSA